MVRVPLIAVGAAAYLGLPVLGWGGFAPLFSHPALIALAVGLAVLTGVSFFAGGNLSPGVREDRGNRWVLAAFGLIGLLDGYLPAYADRKEIWTIDGDTARWLGVVLFAAGGALRIWPVLCSATGSAGWSPSNPDTRCSPAVYMVSSFTQLSGIACQLAGMGLGVSFGGGRTAHRAYAGAARRAHPRGRKAVALCDEYSLLRPDIAVDSQGKLARPHRKRLRFPVGRFG
jgi:hypothetical protein